MSGNEITLGVKLTADGNSLVGEIKLSREEIDKLAKSTGNASSEAAQLNQQNKSLASSFGSVSDMVKSAAAALGLYKLASLAQESALLAARYETMGIVMRIAGNNAGYHASEMEKYTKELQKNGISMLQSRDAVIQLATANIDLSKAAAIGRAAQDLAVVANVNSSEAMARMIHGIKSGEIEVLRTLGLNVSFENSYKSLAAQLGINSNALTEQQKVMARTNAVISESARYNGIYEESMTTAGKAISSLTRYWENLKVKAGEAFLPALADGVFRLTDALKAANVELDKAGSTGLIERIGQGLGGAFKTVYETVVVLGANVAYVLNGIGTEIGGIAAQAAAILRGDFSGSAKIGVEMRRDAEAARKAVDAFSESVLNNGKAVTTVSKVSEEARIASGAAARDQATAADKAAEANKKSKDSYAQLYNQISKVGAELLATSGSQDKLTHAQKLALDVMVGIQTGSIKLTEAEKIRIAATLESVLAIDKQNTAQIEAAKIAQDWATANDKLAQTVQQSNVGLEADIEKLKMHNEEIGLNKEQLALLVDTRNANSIAMLQEKLSMTELTDSNSAYLSALMDQIRLLKEKAYWTSANSAKQINSDNSQKALDDLNKFLDPNKAKSFGDALKGAFSAAGDAMVKLTSVLEDYGAKQAEIDQARIDASAAYAGGKLTENEYAEKSLAISNAESTMRISAYADMAGAAKGFFDANSKGYKTLEGIEKAYRAYQMAQRAVDAVTAIIKAAAQTGWVGMIAMGGAMAALGYGVSGGFNSGGDAVTAQQRQDTQGTGTVLGDVTAKSDSIAASLEEISKIDKIGLLYTHDMLDALISIKNSMADLASLIYRTTGLTTGQGFGVIESNIKNTGDPLLPVRGPEFGILDDITGGLVTGLENLWGGKKVSVTDTGLQINGRLGDLSQGQGMRQYADVQTTNTSWFGLVKKTDTETITQELGDEMSKQLGMVFANIGRSVVAAGTALGLDSEAFRASVENFVIDLGNVSFKDLKGQELQDQINAVFSSASDSLAAAVLPGFEKFQAVGEGYYQTVMRVAATNESVTHTMRALGLTMNLTGMEAISARMNLVDLAGGLEEFNKQVSFYFNNFYSDAERSQIGMKNLRDEFSRMGVALPTSTAGFRALVEGIDQSTAAGQERFSKLMAIAPAWKTEMDLIESINTKAADDEKQRIDEMTSAINTRYQVEIDALENVKASLSEMLNISQALAAFVKSLKTSDLSTLDPGQKLAAAAADYTIQLAQARAGDMKAAGALQGTSQTYLDLARQYYSSSTQYADIFNSVTAALDQLATDYGLSYNDQMLSLTQQIATLQQSNINEIAKLNATSIAGFLMLSDSLATGTAGDTTLLQMLSGMETTAIVSALDQLETDNYTRFLSLINTYVSAMVPLDSLTNDPQRVTDTIYYLQQYGVSSAQTATAIGDQYGVSQADLINWALDHGLPAFAEGGEHTGGWRMVGERGPELEFTGPSRIYNAADTRSMMSARSAGAGATATTNNDEIVEELRALVALQSAANARLIEQLGKVEKRLASAEDRARMEGSLA